MGIADFLESRIVADEALARAAVGRAGITDSRLELTADSRISATGWRMLAECALKRDMLFVHHDVPQEVGHHLRIY